MSIDQPALGDLKRSARVVRVALALNLVLADLRTPVDTPALVDRIAVLLGASAADKRLIARAVSDIARPGTRPPECEVTSEPARFQGFRKRWWPKGQLPGGEPTRRAKRHTELELDALRAQVLEDMKTAALGRDGLEDVL